MKFKWLSTLVLCVTAVACGGGGGGGGVGAVAESAAGVSGSGPGTGGGSAPPPGPPGASLELVRGVITGFGSVFIDGRRFDTSDAVISKDDEDASEAELSIGMVVEVRADLSTARASRIDFEEDIKGPVDAISENLLELVVLGQTVTLLPDSILHDGLAVTDLLIGDVLEVSGLRGANDVLEATFLERERSTEVKAYKVIGQLRALDTDAQTFRIGGLTIDYSTARLEDGLALVEGITVEVKDQSKAYSPGAFTLVASAVEPAGLGRVDDNLDDPDRAQLEGLITAVDSPSAFEIGGIIVNYDANTRFRYGDSTRLAVGTRVKVSGMLEGEGSIRAAEIKFARNSTRIHGLVEMVDTVAMTLRILGISVDVSGVEAFEDERDQRNPFSIHDILPGDFLEIRGAGVNGAIIANEVAREDDDETRLRGTATVVDAEAGTLNILGVAIVTSANTRYEGFDDEVLSRQAFFEAIADGQTLIDAQWSGSITDTTVAVRELSLEE